MDLVEEIVLGRWKQSASVYLSSPSDVCPPAIGCLPGWVAELSPTAHEVLNTEPE